MKWINQPIEKTDIVLAIFSLSNGGAERVISEMANYWASKNMSVSIVTYSGAPSFYILNPHVMHFSLKLDNSSTNFFFAIINNIRRIYRLLIILKISKPHVVISFMPSMNVLCIFISRLLGIPIIISERNDPLSSSISLAWRLARRISYRLANYVVVQSNQAMVYFSKICKRSKIIVIHNPIGFEFSQNTLLRSRESFKIFLNVGRLEYVKGQDILIKAFYNLHRSDWKLYIVGEGRERANLESLIGELHLEDQVILFGRKENVVDFYQKADIFVLSSRSEGFPNCLLEAMSCSLPCICTRCGGGVEEIIESGSNGILVATDDISELTDTLRVLMNSPFLCDQLASAAKLKSSSFDLDAIMGKWGTLIESCHFTC